LKKTRRGKFSEISGIFRISEIPKFGNFSEIFRKFRKFRKTPEIVPGKSSIFERYTNEYSLKPGKNPRIFPPKSRGNPRHFRKIPEVVPGKSAILEMLTNDYSLKPRKNPGIFPPKSRGNSRKFWESRKSHKSRKVVPFFVETTSAPFPAFMDVLDLTTKVYTCPRITSYEVCVVYYTRL
jgi:hypothetical protein